MPLIVGARLGPYEVVAKLGEGGMGEVYRARDTKLERHVAIKILPELFADDPERLARFQREARTLAALNHPNIGGIHGLEESGGLTALVLEYVDGPTLADLIARGPIPLAEALSIANDIALAIEAAHEQGIIHRDLKPANIKVRPDGAVKVLDFGLAKALATETSDPPSDASPTLSLTGATRAGTVLGTAAYMSPEQAKGKSVDRRTDVWAFGAVLYEMLAGKKPFAGEDLSDTIVAVFRDEPDWSALPADVPPHVRQALRVCLQKDPKRRVRDMSAVRLALEGVFDAPAQPGAAARPAAVSGRGTRNVAAVAGGALVVGALIAAGVMTFMRPPTTTPAPAPRVAQFIVETPDETVSGATISTDGARLVYRMTVSGETALYRRELGAVETVRISGTEGTPNLAASNFALSPDGAWVVFQQGTTLRRAPVVGGPAQMVCELSGNLQPVAWGPGDEIIFSTTGTAGLRRVRAAGGEPETLTTAEPSRPEHAFPDVLPDGRGLLFVESAGTLDTSRIMVRLPSGETRELIQRGTTPKFVSSGHIVFAVGSALIAVPFDVTQLKVTGEPVTLLEGLALGGNRRTASFGISADGSLVFQSGGGGLQRRTLLWVDRSGKEEPINVPARAYTYARLSPDETRVALDSRDEEFDIWIWDLVRGSLQRFTTDPGFNRAPVWSRDGTRLAFTAIRDGQQEGVYWKNADGSGTPERLSVGPGIQGPSSFALDDRSLVVDTPMSPPYDMLLLNLDGERRQEPLLATTFSERSGVISPDGRWLAYQSNESGTNEVYLSPFPDVSTGKRLVSSGSGTRPVWRPDGRELFYFVEPDTFMSVAVTPGNPPTLGKPAGVVKKPYAVALNDGPHYDVSRDGRLLLIRSADDQPVRSEIRLIQHWTEELKRLVPISK